MRKLLLLGAMALSLGGIAQTQIQMGLPAHNSVLTGNVRGYYFTAPTCFTITGLRVPTEASTGNQSIAVVRLQATPPLYATTTNNFTVLYLTQNDPATGIITVNIPVETGDIIGILGYRATSNSYGTANYATTINGFPVTLNRLGMQFPLTTTAPQDLWTESGGSISRVEMYYDTVITHTATHTVLNQADVQFTSGADTSFTSVWDYGDGSPLDTTDSPMHSYAVGGTYTACEYVTNACGTDTICMSVTVCGPGILSSMFSYSATTNMVSFTNASANAISYQWDFGDLTTDTASNPMHTYTASGTYYVCLTANSLCSTEVYCDSIVICIPATAGFSSTGMGPGMFMFGNTSTEASMWSWDFGDGSPVDTAMNPSHTYSVNGTYNVCLVATGCSSDTICSSITTCPEALSASFTSSDTATTATFVNTSAGAMTYLWDFGDSTTSTQQDPVHVYANTGLYTVCLTSWNMCGDSITACDTILLIITDNMAIAAGAGISVYPNPVSESTTITVAGSSNGMFVFEVYDAAGRIVRSQNGNFNTPMNFDRSGLADGNYTYRVIAGASTLGNGQLILSK